MELLSAEPTKTEGGADRQGGREFGLDLVKRDTPAGHPRGKVKASRGSGESGALMDSDVKDTVNEVCNSYFCPKCRNLCFMTTFISVRNKSQHLQSQLSEGISGSSQVSAVNVLKDAAFGNLI